MKCLGIDLGSTSLKGAVLDLGANAVGRVRRRPFPDSTEGLPAGHFEVPTGPIVDATKELIDVLLSDEPAAEAVFFSSQMGGVVLVEQSCRPLTPYLSWRDQRSLAPAGLAASYLAAVRQRLSPGQFSELGQELKAGSATSLLFWLRENDQLPIGAVPLTLGGFVTAALCGEQPSIDPTEAIGLLHVGARDWHQEVFDALGLERLRWPRLQTCHQPCGMINRSGHRLTCHPAVGDHPCSLLGVGLAVRELSINVSTGSQVSLLTSTVKLGPWQTRCGFDRQYLNTITHLPAGRALNALVQLLTAWRSCPTDDPWPEILAAVDQAPESELAVELTFFDGPLGSQGAIKNITVDNLTVGGLFRAAFRNMADNYQACAERLAESGPWDRIVLSGGLTQRVPPLRQFIQQRFDKPIRECPEGEDALLGLLRLAQRTYG